MKESQKCRTSRVRRSGRASTRRPMRAKACFAAKTRRDLGELGGDGAWKLQGSSLISLERAAWMPVGPRMRRMMSGKRRRAQSPESRTVRLLRLQNPPGSRPASGQRETLRSLAQGRIPQSDSKMETLPSIILGTDLSRSSSKIHARKSTQPSISCAAWELRLFKYSFATWPTPPRSSMSPSPPGPMTQPPARLISATLLLVTLDLLDNLLTCLTTIGICSISRGMN